MTEFLRRFLFLALPHVLLCVLMYFYFKGASGGDIGFRFFCTISLSVYVWIASIFIIFRAKRKKSYFLALLVLVAMEVLVDWLFV
jgi:hypothetical protein